MPRNFLYLRELGWAIVRWGPRRWWHYLLMSICLLHLVAVAVSYVCPFSVTSGARRVSVVNSTIQVEVYEDHARPVENALLMRWLQPRQVEYYIYPEAYGFLSGKTRWLCPLIPAAVFLCWICFLALLPSDKRPDSSVCGVCGYDLRGSVSPRCSECGSPRQ